MVWPFWVAVFENYVNYAGSKTRTLRRNEPIVFENYVNYAGSKTELEESIANIDV